MAERLEILDNIFYVGVKDWNVRDFHGYTTTRGSSYNAYLILDKKNVLIDTAKAAFSERLLENIASVIDPSKIDYVISNHTEPDHSGSMPAVMEAMPDATVIATAKGKEGLLKYYGGDWKWQIVKTGDSLEIGNRKLEFISTPMLHWPDSMFTYSRADKLLFSMDGFGQHYANSFLFDDEAPFEVLMQEAKKYYANILMHLGGIAKKTLAAAEGLPIEMIAPSHGLLWRKHIPDIINAYLTWVDCKPASKVLVIYDSMWGSTETMARAILEGASRHGVDARLLKLSANDLTDVTTEVLDAGAIAIGSPTLNNGLMPSVSAFLTYMQGLKPAGKTGAAFGSHGWGGGGAVAVDAALDKIGIARMRPPITCVYKPDAAVIDDCRKLGSELAEKVAVIK